MVDLEAYSGVWYEIMRNNAFYELECQTSVAQYEIIDGVFHITNYCYQSNPNDYIKMTPVIPGHPDLKVVNFIKGIAKPTKYPNIFKIKFENIDKLGIYRIYFTDYDNFSIIGDIRTQYFVVLSRNAKVTHGEKALLLKILDDLGFKNYEMTV